MKQRINEIYPDVHFIENFDYVSTNNMYSAYLARYAMRDSDFLMMNADVFYDKTVLTSLIACDAPNAIVTDIGLYNDESMKVIERNGRIVQISKTISAEDALGCSIDVYKFSRIGGQMFFDMCTDYIEKEHILNKWSEVALNDILEIIAIAESTPGPIAINSATFVGYRVAGFFGAMFATLGVVLPSFIIILVISYLLKGFEHIRAVKYAFWGIRAGVMALLVKAWWGMFKKCPKGVISYAIAAFSFVAAVLAAQLNISVIYVLICCALIGLISSVIIKRRALK